MPTLSVLLVGDAQRSEFREAVAALRAGAAVVVAPDLATAERLLAEGVTPDLLVLAQAFPGQFPIETVARLRRHVPLARVIGLLGSWCEGEVRTGRPWPGAVRVYWHQWLPRCPEELRALAEGRSSSWALPSTASDEERFLAAAERPPTVGQGQIGIVAQQFDVQDWLAAACRQAGYTAVWLREEQPPGDCGLAALVFDFGGEIDTDFGRLCRLVKQFGDVPVVALVNFPRIEDHERLRAAGVTAVLSKPVLLEDLQGELGRLIRGRQP